MAKKNSRCPPRLIIISGPPGCGKTTLAASIARALRAVHLDKDCIDESFSPHDRGQHYTEAIEPRVLDALLVLAARNLENGLDVILDAPWSHIMLNTPSWASRLQALSTSHTALLRVLECVLPSELLRQRLATRGLQRDQIKLQSESAWLQFLRTDRIGELVPLPHHTIDMTLSPVECTRAAMTYIG